MANVEGPRLATAEEFDEIARTADWFFNFEEGGYLARWPQNFDRSGRGHAVITVDGEIVSHVAAMPRTLAVGDCRIESWGITGVGTLPPHQGNGYMSALLEFWLDRMDEADVPLSELGGDRVRYGRFGWEIGDRECFYDVDERSFPGDPATSPAVHRYEGAAADRETIAAIHDREDLRVVRDASDYETLLDKRGVDVLVHAGDDPAYVCFTRDTSERQVTEFGGSEVGVEALLGHLLAAYRTESLTVRAHPAHPTNALFRRLSNRWRVVPHRMFRVNDLRAVLDALAPRLAARWDGGDGRVTLGVGDGEAVELAYEPGNVAVTAFDGDPDVVLDRRAAVHLLLGAPGDVPAVDHPFLASTLPLDVYVWRTDAV